MARLTGKVVLITGAAGGQGTAEAELFVREEGSVVVGHPGTQVRFPGLPTKYALVTIGDKVKDGL